ncbi:MAG: SGNH/GDSL hydrolase family protein [Phycisphaeraceae bacterium]|nr:SGNH/GDSL hydrolase family protein [Phycisphaeraceae bacterium]
MSTDSPPDSPPTPSDNTPRFPRRTLLKSAAAIGAAGALGVTGVSRAADTTQPAEEEPAGKVTLGEGAVIVFQGDSITDAGRKKDQAEPNHNKALGKGYPALAAGELLSDYADLGLKVYNRGISGNKIPDLAERWDEDTIALKPTVLSILIGINDLWHTVAFGRKYKATVADYETGYRRLIERTQEQVPGVQIVICEPFTLRDWPEFDPYRAVAAKLAQAFELPFVPFHSAFHDAVTEDAPAKFWLWDGIHPQAAGHALMLQTWRRAVGI